MIYIEKIFEGYYTGTANPPHASVDYRSLEILSSSELTKEMRARGVSESDLRIAFAEADRYWKLLPPRRA